jgi:hypothetical protein
MWSGVRLISRARNTSLTPNETLGTRLQGRAEPTRWYLGRAAPGAPTVHLNLSYWSKYPVHWLSVR